MQVNKNKKLMLLLFLEDRMMKFEWYWWTYMEFTANLLHRIHIHKNIYISSSYTSLASRGFPFSAARASRVTIINTTPGATKFATDLSSVCSNSLSPSDDLSLHLIRIHFFQWWTRLHWYFLEREATVVASAFGGAACRVFILDSSAVLQREIFLDRHGFCWLPLFPQPVKWLVNGDNILLKRFIRLAN